MTTLPSSEPSYPIRSVDKALELLLLFGERREISVSEAADVLGVARSTAHRMLSMLHHRDFVRQDERSKLYFAGPALVQAGLAAIHQIDLRQEIRPHIEALVRRVGETAHLQVRQGRNVLFFDGVESGFAVRAAQRIGEVLPAHCTAGGKALLAQMSEAEINAFLEGAELIPLTDRSIVDADALKAQLVEIQSRGWAWNNEESEIGLRALAVALPVSDRLVMPAAITVAGPSFRMSDECTLSISQALTATVRQLATGRPPMDGSVSP